MKIYVASSWRNDYYPAAIAGYRSDLQALRDAAAVVLVLPSGRSAHLEAGYALGQGKPVFIWSPLPERPELMYAMTHGLEQDLEKIVGLLHTVARCFDVEEYKHYTRRLECDA